MYFVPSSIDHLPQLLHILGNLVLKMKEDLQKASPASSFTQIITETPLLKELDFSL